MNLTLFDEKKKKNDCIIWSRVDGFLGWLGGPITKNLNEANSNHLKKKENSIWSAFQFKSLNVKKHKNTSGEGLMAI